MVICAKPCGDARGRHGKTPTIQEEPPMPKKAKPTPKKPQSKTKFILAQPKKMLAKDVVAKGRATGLTLTEKYVWQVRSAAKRAARKAKPAPRAKAAAAPKPASAAKTKRGKPITKAAYVLGFPPGTPAANIVSKGKTEGIKLSIAHVYSIRSAVKARGKAAKAKSKAAKAKTGAKAKPGGKAAKTPKAKAVKTPATLAFRSAPRTGSLDEQFVGLVLDMGLARSTELLSTIKERVKGLTLG